MRALHELTIVEAGEALRAGAVTATALTEAVLARIEATEPTLNAYITVTAEIARAEAAAVEVELRAGIERGPLQGIPFAYKDLFDTAGVRTTAGSKYLVERVPARDAAAVERLREAGVVLTGKLGLPNYFGSTSVEPPFGVVRNPWNASHEPGSSSGGSAAATAAGSCLASLGTDSGGSVRSPASLSGVCGLKPTFGLVPTDGVLALAWTLDTVGILARSAEDVALVLNVIAGGGAEDPEGGAAAADYTRLLGRGLAGLRVGVPRDALWQELDEEVEAACEAALEAMRGEGAGAAGGVVAAADGGAELHGVGGGNGGDVGELPGVDRAGASGLAASAVAGAGGERGGVHQCAAAAAFGDGGDAGSIRVGGRAGVADERGCGAAGVPGWGGGRGAAAAGAADVAVQRDGVAGAERALRVHGGGVADRAVDRGGVLR